MKETQNSCGNGNGCIITVMPIFIKDIKLAA